MRVPPHFLSIPTETTQPCNIPADSPGFPSLPCPCGTPVHGPVSMETLSCCIRQIVTAAYVYYIPAYLKLTDPLESTTENLPCIC